MTTGKNVGVRTYKSNGVTYVEQNSFAFCTHNVTEIDMWKTNFLNIYTKYDLFGLAFQIMFIF